MHSSFMQNILLTSIYSFVQIRVSAEISNAPIILNLDCDMYSNNSDTIQEVLCFFMDEKRGHEVAYVQFPQNYDNLTENDVYANCSRVTNGVSVYSFSFSYWTLDPPFFL